jgi:AcrR family transcriptional regulator
MPPTKPARRKPGEARAQLLTAARELFVQQGYAGTSTRQIADTAQVAEVLIFRHFANKKGLFEAAIIEPFSKIFDEWIAGATDRAGSETTPELVGDYIAELYPLILANRDLVLALVAALAHESEIHEDDTNDSLSSAFAHIEAFTAAQMIERDVHGLDLPVTVRVAASMVIGMALLDPWLFGTGRRRPSQKRLVDEMIAFMTFGVAGRA